MCKNLLCKQKEKNKENVNFKRIITDAQTAFPSRISEFQFLSQVFDEIENQLTSGGFDTVFGELFDPHELPGRLMLSQFFLLLSIHGVSLHSKYC